MVQVFVRWTLPRFRYDQLMKLGWRMLLPASLANILVTGVVWLALDKAGPAASDALKLAADVTQAVVAVALAYLVLRARHRPLRLGARTSATSSARRPRSRRPRGGTKTAPMQA